jgi:YD repeat-containing protein
VRLGFIGLAVDDRGRLEQFGLPNGPEFDLVRRGQPLASATSSGTQLRFTYDRAGRLKTTSDPSSTVTVTYNSAGLPSRLDFAPSGGSESFTYNSSDQVVGYSDSGGDTGTFSYSAGHLATATITLTAMDPSYSFTYSPSGRLKSWTQTDTITETFDLTVNSSGDVTKVAEGTATAAVLSYAAPHVLTKVTDGAATTFSSFTYDGKGRLFTATDESSHTKSFHYNALGRLSSVTYPVGASPVTSTLSYDSLGRLVKVTPSNGGELTLVYMPAPAATTAPASKIARGTTTLNGTVNPRGLPTRYRFQFGKTRSYGSSTPVRSAGSGKAPLAVAASLANLAPATTYHYRLIATSAAGTTVGIDRTFHTKARS